MFKYNTHESDGVTDGGPDAFRSLEASQSAGECERWIYNLDYGYTSMTSEVIVIYHLLYVYVVDCKSKRYKKKLSCS